MLLSTVPRTQYLINNSIIIVIILTVINSNPNSGPAKNAWWEPWQIGKQGSHTPLLPKIITSLGRKARISKILIATSNQMSI